MHLLALLVILAPGAWNLRQSSPQESGRAFATQPQLEQTIGSEAEARRLVKELVARTVRDRAGRTPSNPTVVNIIAEQLPEAWLPVVDGVQFRRWRLSDALVAWNEKCLELLWITARVAETRLTVTVADGNRCDSAGNDYLFDRTSKGWTAYTGIGGGSLGGTTDCPCAARGW